MYNYLKILLVFILYCHLFIQISSDCLQFHFPSIYFSGIWPSFSDIIGQAFQNRASVQFDFSLSQHTAYAFFSIFHFVGL